MKKILLSFLMLVTAVLSASAFTIYVADDYTGKTGEILVAYKYNTVGNSDQLQYTVRYEINTEATGTASSTPALVSIRDIVYEGNLKGKIKDYEFPAFFSIEKRDGTKMGYGRVNMIGAHTNGSAVGDLFLNNEVVETVTLNFYEDATHYIGVGPSAFEGCTSLKHIYVMSDKVSRRRPTFDAIWRNAFQITTSFTDTVTVNTKEIFGVDGFYKSGIVAFEATYGSNSRFGKILEQCPNLTSITLGGGTKDGSSVAYDCPKLTKAVWTGSGYDLDKPEQSPFYSVRGQITSLTIAGSVPAHMFEGFTNIRYVSSPSDLGTKTITIGARSFGGCSKLTSAAVGGNMDQSAFEDCPNLKNLVWRGGFSWGSETPSAAKSPLRSLGVQLQKITFRGDNTSIPDYLCAGMKQLETVFIDRLQNGQVGAHAFEGCTKLTSVDFSDEDGNLITGGNTYWIWESAFAGCTSLNEIINLPSSLLWRIDDKAFYNCTSLEDCPITQKFTALRHIGTEAFAGSDISELVIPAGVTTTGNLLVNDCERIEEVYFLPNTTSAMDFGGSWAELFAGQDNVARKSIHTIYLNHQLTLIPDEMFVGYTGLVNQFAVVPSETNPRNLTLMLNVKTIGTSAFKDCESLQNCAALFSPALTQIYPSAFENSNIKSSLDYMNNLTTIWNDAFKNCKGITRFGAEKTDGAENVLPNLQTISANAFDGCENLKSVHLPANLKTLSSDAFANCPIETVLFGITAYTYADPLGNAGIDIAKVKVLEIADNVTNIPAYLATGSTLKSVKIGYNVQSVGTEAFADCDQLTEVTINSNLPGMPTNYNVMNPTIAPFVRSAVEKAKFGAGATVAGRCILAGTTRLKEVDLGSVVEFGAYSFSNTGLEEFTFNNTTTIGVSSFSNNASLKTLNIAGTAPATLSSSAFDGCSVEVINATCSAFGTVSAASEWKAVCANILNADGTFDYPDMSNNFYYGQGEQKITDPLNCDGKFTVEAVPATGYTFVSWVDGNTENPRVVDMNEYSLTSLYPVFDNPDLYTEEIRLDITPEHAGTVKVFNEDNGLEITNGKFKRDTRFVFVPQAPDAGNWYEFSRWQFDDTKSATLYSADEPLYPNGLSIDVMFTPGGEMDNEIADFPQEVTAVFEPKDIVVEVRSCTDGHGTIKIEGEAKLGKTVTLTAVPDKGYAFNQWGNDDQATNASVQVALTPEKILKAASNPDEVGTPVLDPNTNTLMPYEESALYYVELCASFIPASEKKVTVSASGDHCTVEGAGVYKYGEEVTLNVFADPYYSFEKWSDGNTDNPRIFTATENMTLTAVCTPDLCMISTVAEPAEGGTVTGAGEKAYNETVELFAQPAEGYEFVEWKDDATAPAKRQIIVKGPATYTAVFRLIQDGLEDIIGDTQTNRKVMIDGAIYILRDGKVYSILGQTAE